MNERVYNCEIKKSYGACDSSLFKKMATRGDITSKKIKDSVNDVIKITGYANCEVTTSEKSFSICYYATDRGFYSSGSEVFYKSVIDYIDEVDKFIIAKVQTKKGSTYKAVPVLDSCDDETGEIE